MNCATVRELFCLDPRRLTRAERAAWLRHVKGCNACTDYCHTLQGGQPIPPEVTQMARSMVAVDRLDGEWR